MNAQTKTLGFNLLLFWKTLKRLRRYLFLAVFELFVIVNQILERGFGILWRVFFTFERERIIAPERPNQREHEWIL